jgi:MFS family permease
VELDPDSRILTLALARMVDALANSFLVVVLPLYTGSQVVALPGFVGTMVALRFLQGVAGASVFAPSLALAGDLAGEGRSGSTRSVLTMGFGLGIALGTLLSGILVGFGFVVPFVVATVGGAVGLALVYTQVEETVAEPTGMPSVGD